MPILVPRGDPTSMQCNIDRRGRYVRLIWGIMLMAGAIFACMTWAVESGEWMAWAVVAVLAVAGLLGVYEARKGWCIVRAMGWRTPI